MCLVAELQQEVDRLRSIQESKDVDWWNHALPSLEQKCQLGFTNDKGDLALHQAESSDLRDSGEWKQFSAQGSGRSFSLSTLPCKVPLQQIQVSGIGRTGT